MNPLTPPSAIPSAAVIRSFTLGVFATNSYVLHAGSACWVVDPSFGPGPILRYLESQSLRPAAIVLTHAHVDHIAGVADVCRTFPGTPVLIHDAEAAWLSDPMLNLSGLSGMSVTSPGPHGALIPGASLSLGDIAFRILHTPGHSPGSVSLYAAGWPDGRGSTTPIVISGDALFAGSIGRTDFPGSDHETLIRSIRNTLYALPEETAVYCGHGPSTTIGREKRTNPYARG